MPLDQELIDAAIEQMESRFPPQHGGAAALRTSDGQIFTSVGLETSNDAANLCYETGAICEVFRLDMQVVASACVSRDIEPHNTVILPACGVCQERLMIWGPEVEIAVPVPGRPGEWIAKKLGELQPYHWTKYAFD